MRAIVVLGLCASIVVVGIAAAMENKKVDINLDKKSAVAIAEIVLVKVYGEQVRNERPWNVSIEGGIFNIEGTLPPDTVGGVAMIKIRRTNGEVVDIIHGK